MLAFFFPSALIRYRRFIGFCVCTSERAFHLYKHTHTHTVCMEYMRSNVLYALAWFYVKRWYIEFYPFAEKFASIPSVSTSVSLSLHASENWILLRLCVFCKDRMNNPVQREKKASEQSLVYENAPHSTNVYECFNFWLEAFIQPK